MSTLTQSFVSMLGRRMHAEAWPARVLQELEREQYRSELLVTAVQLLIAAILAVLYAITPSGFSPDAPIRAVPLGLTLFSVIALIRLYLAVTGQLQRWMVGATVVTEMAVLMFVIWAYHLQYEQPAPFSLKCTEFAYVFILIALRTLRDRGDDGGTRNRARPRAPLCHPVGVGSAGLADNLMRHLSCPARDRGAALSCPARQCARCGSSRQARFRSRSFHCRHHAPLWTCVA